MKKNLTGLLLIVFLLALVAPVFGDPWTFVVMGDSRPSYIGVPYPQVYSRIISEINLIKPDLVLNTGDLILSLDSPEAAEQGFSDFLKLTRNLIPKIYFTPGNHDYENANLQKSYLGMVDPRPYYSFDYKGCHFISLNTEISGEEGMITNKQLAWLKADLEKNKNNPLIFAFMHRPMFSATNPDLSPLLKVNFKSHQNRDQLDVLFNQYKVRAVFAGHEHVLYHQKSQGVDYYITGGSGAPLYLTHQTGGVFNYLVVEVGDNDIKVNSLIPFEIYWDQTKDGIEVVNSGEVPVLMQGIPLKKSDGFKVISCRNGKFKDFQVVKEKDKIYLKAEVPSKDCLKIKY